MNAWRAKFVEYLLPAAEQDEGFRHEVLRHSRIGLAVIGGIQIGVSLFMLLARLVVDSGSAAMYFRVKQGALIILLGVINLALCRFTAVERWARPIGAISALLTAAVLIWASLLALSQTTNPDDFIPGQVTLIMLVGITIIPLKPLHAFTLGLSIGTVYLVSTLVAQSHFFTGTGPDQNYLLFIFMLTLLCTGITAVVYHQRRANYDLRQAQARMLLAENAASMARLAAALSHELNTPMGALLSGVDTLLLLASKQATCSPPEQQRLVVLQADIRKSIQESVNRLRSLVTRMQRFTNLDQAEVQDANLNELLTDVTALVEPNLRKKAEFALDLGPIPPVRCKPQQISAVFSNLVQNALEALDGDGGQIRIATRQVPGAVEIEIADSGRGVDRRDLENIFDPGFKVTGKRVRSGNWGMFTSRQIVREHGGEIRMSSRPGIGTSVIVTLPAQAEAGVSTSL